MSTATDLADIAGKLKLRQISGPQAIRLSFEVRERVALRVTLITHIDGLRSCLYGRQAVSNDHGVRTIEYPECTRDEWRELHDQTTTIRRVREILDNLTSL